MSAAMPRVVFSHAMQRHVDCPPLEVMGGDVRAALDAAFARNPAVRSYVLDDQAHVRKHISIFVDGNALRDRKRLSDPVTSASEILIVPALSGG
jgi:sulfur-carrier protein